MNNTARTKGTISLVVVAMILGACVTDTSDTAPNPDDDLSNQPSVSEPTSARSDTQPGATSSDTTGNEPTDVESADVDAADVESADVESADMDETASSELEANGWRVKLDPVALEMVEAGQESDSELVVIVALSSPADDQTISALESAGLDVRSRLGDIITGTIAVDRLRELALEEQVIVIEANRPVAPEEPPTG